MRCQLRVTLRALLAGGAELDLPLLHASNGGEQFRLCDDALLAAAHRHAGLKNAEQFCFVIIFSRKLFKLLIGLCSVLFSKFVVD